VYRAVLIALGATLHAVAQARGPADTSALTRPPARAEGMAYSAAFEGRKAATLRAVETSSGDAALERALASGDSGWLLTPRYAALVRFGLWDELIALGPPADSRAPGLSAGYLYGRGVALAARGRLDEARATLAELERLGASVAPDARAGANRLRDLVRVAAPIVAARIAASEYAATDAVTALERAVEAEDRLAAAQPPDWFFPVRDLLGAQLLIAGHALEAEGVYREDLRRNPGNGWALYGLAAALRAQGRDRAAAASAREFAVAWKSADVRLSASAFWFAGPDHTRCECERQPSGDR
jgi:tetratricopeptide (TPR) repeat protein